MGLTTACLRAFSSQNSKLQVPSLVCLLTLLQGGNAHVQETVAIFLSSPKRAYVFAALRNAITDGTSHVKKYRRILRRISASGAGGSTALVDELGIALAEDKLGEQLAAFACNTFGKQSRLAITLRLLQVLCSTQYKPMQDLMVQQSQSAQSSNLLLACIEFFLSAQPLICDALLLNEVHLPACIIQCAATITEAVSGMHTANVREVLASDLLSSINKLLDSMTYVPVAPGDSKSEIFMEFDKVEISANDVRCYVKGAALQLCHALFESVTDMSDQEKVAEAINPTILVSVITETASMLNKSSIELPTASKRREATGMKGGMGMSAVRRHASNMSKALLRSGFDLDITKGQENGVCTKYGFGEGCAESLRAEMLSCFQLMLECADFDKNGTFGQALKQLKAEDADLSRALWRLTSSVEVAVKDNKGSGSHVEKIFFPLSSRMGVIESTQFRGRFKDMILALPRDNAQEKGRHFVRQIRAMLRRLEWLDLCYEYKTTAWLMEVAPQLNIMRLIVAICITFLLIFFYGIPMDPNTDEPLAEGSYYGIIKRPGYKDRPYPFANETSDPEGIGKMYSTVMRADDLSIMFRISLHNRWEDDAQWAFAPSVRNLVFFLGAMHVILCMLKCLSFLILDFPLVW
jgi:hypothetical protein